MDGISSKIFLENLASLLAENDLVLAPYNNRLHLAARSSPTISFPHPELFKLESLQRCKPNQIPFTALFHKLDSKIFRLSDDCIVNLKHRASRGIAPAGALATSFNVVSAHIWRCLSLVRNSENNDPEKISTMLYAINVRSRVKPRLPTSYTGNALLNAHCTATYGQLENGPFSDIVKMISEGATRINNEYIRSSIDWLEIYKGFPCGDAMISSWWKLGLNDIEYPWGKPKWSCPVVHKHGNNAIVLLPDIDIVKGKTNDGVNVLVSLPHKHMETFQRLIYKLDF